MMMAVRDTHFVVALLAVHNRLALTQRCLEALKKAAAGCCLLRCIVVDDGSSDGTAEWLAAQPEVTVIRGDGQLWFGGATDLGLKRVLVDFPDQASVLILNNDTFVHPHAIAAMLRAAADDEARVVTAAFWVEDREIEGSSGFLWKRFSGLRDVCLSPGWREAHQAGDGRYVPVDAVATTLTLIPVGLLRKTRLPDPQLHPHNRYDAILSARMRKAGARFACSTDFLAAHLYGPMTRRPTARTMTLGQFWRESLNRRSIFHLAGNGALAVEAAPDPLEAVCGILRLLLRFFRQLTAVTIQSVRPPRAAVLEGNPE